MTTTKEIAGEVVQSAISVHRVLGPGLLESAYQRCLAIELQGRGPRFQKEKTLSLGYRGKEIPDVYRLEFVVENLVVLEVKSVARWEPIFDAQILT